MESSQTRDQTHVPWIGRFLSTEPPGKSVSYFLTGKTPASVTSEFQRAEQLLIKGGAALKPPEARLKGPVRVIKIRRLDHLRPWTHPSLVSSPTLLKLPRIQDCSVTQWCPILFESQVCVSLKTVTFFFFLQNIHIYLCLCWVFIAAFRLSLVTEIGSYSLTAEHRLSCLIAVGSLQTRDRTCTAWFLTTGPPGKAVTALILIISPGLINLSIHQGTVLEGLAYCIPLLPGK